MRGHKANISSLSSLSSSSTTAPAERVFEIVSCGEDGQICVWRNSSAYGSRECNWELSCTLTGFSASIIAHDSFSLISQGAIISACDSSGRLNVWYRGVSYHNNSYRLIHSTNIAPSQLPNCMKLFTLPFDAVGSSVSVVFAMGSVDSKVHLKLLSLSLDNIDPFVANDVTLQTVGILSGHEDWVTCLSVRLHITSSGEQAVYLASGSQDAKIRLWRVSGTAVANNSSLPLGLVAVSNGGTFVFDNLKNNLIGDDVVEDEVGEDDDCEEGESATVPVDDDERGDDARCQFTRRDGQFLYSVYLEALLIGHEEWVTSVQWVVDDAPATDDEDRRDATQCRSGSAELKLFSTSMVRMILCYHLIIIISKT